MSREGALAPATVRIPDLSLLILETKDEGETLLSLRLTSANPALGYNLKLFGPTRLQSDPFAYFQSLFTDIERLPIQSAADKAKAEITLANMGATLFGDLMPDELKNILWTLRASITSVQVQSEEPWIPWELCKLVSAPAGGGVEEGPFLCEAFQLTRWIPGLPQFPQVRMNRLALVVPDDSGLAFAAAERDYMLSLASTGPAGHANPGHLSRCAGGPGVGHVRHLAFQRSRRLSERGDARPVGHDPARRRPAHARKPERPGGQPGQAPPPGLPERLPDRPVGHVAHGHGRLGHPLLEGWRRRASWALTGRSTTSRP